MKRSFLLSCLCVCISNTNAQLSASDTISDQSANMIDTGNEKLTGYYSNGNKLYETFQRRHDLHGSWNSWYSNGQLLDAGKLHKGIPDGQWLSWYSNGQPRFIRTYSAAKWEQFQNEKSRYHAKRFSLPITQVFHENKNQALKYLTAINTFCATPNCSRAGEENWKETTSNNGKQDHYHPVFQTGLLHGVFVNYFIDGAVKDSGNYKNGLPEGLWIKWTDDKQFFWKGYYQRGLKNKEWKLYSTNAKLIRVIFYRNDKLLWRKDLKEGVEIDE